jgi:farnesyl diphosphate synthase
LDVTADTAVLGKTAGKDADNDKPTYVSLLGLQGAQQEAARLSVQAQQALARQQVRRDKRGDQGAQRHGKTVHKCIVGI